MSAPSSTRDWTKPPFRPQPRQAEALSCPADIAFMGGSVGGGKSLYLCMEAARHMHLKGYSCVMFRKTYPELTMSGGLWERLSDLMRHWPGATAREDDLTWRSPQGGKIKCSHLQHAKNRHDHQSAEYSVIIFDELCGGEDSPGFSEDEFWFMVTRNRNPTCPVRPYVRASMNPNPDSWVRGFIDWWLDEHGYAIPERSGVVRWFIRNPDGEGYLWGDTADEVEALAPGFKALSFTFILSTLADNRALLDRDPDYGSRVAGALHRVERIRLLGEGDCGGNWNIRAGRGGFFQRQWFPVVDALVAGAYTRARGWDTAATPVSPTSPDPDWTAGVRMARNRYGHTFIEDAVRLRGTPAEVERLMVSTTKQDGPGVVQVLMTEPGSAGKAWVERLAQLVRQAGGRTVVLPVPRSRKEEYAKPVSSAAEPADGEEHGSISLVAGAWNAWLLSELEAFPSTAHDDAVDGMSAAWQELRAPGPRLPVTPSSRARETGRRKGRKWPLL